MFSRKTAYKPKYELLKTSHGDFRILTNRRHEAVFFNPPNWEDIRPMTTESAEGHIGHRYLNSFEIDSVNPQTGQKKTFFLKDQETVPGEEPDEIEATIQVRRARVRTERPMGYWHDKLGHTYAIFERLNGRSMLFRQPNDFKYLLDASRQFGQLFAAKLMQDDTGLKHAFIEKGRVHFIDFEALHPEQDPTRLEKDFGYFVAEGVAHGIIGGRRQIDAAVKQFLLGAGIQRHIVIKGERRSWHPKIVRYLKDWLIIETHANEIATSRKTKDEILRRIQRLQGVIAQFGPRQTPHHKA